LSGQFYWLKKVFVCSFLFSFASILAHPSPPTTQGPSTPQIIAFAMICSGRDDKVEKV
jgi:hypothetical protein